MRVRTALRFITGLKVVEQLALLFVALLSILWSATAVTANDDKIIQFYLNQLGFNSGLVDGKPGKKTKSETVIKYLHKIYNFNLDDYILILQPTSPLRKDGDINNTISIALKYNLNTLHSGNYYKKKIKIKKRIILYKNKKLKSFYNKKNYSYNGAIYFFKLGYFIKNKTVYEKLPNIYKMSNKRSLDIDTFKDLNYLNKL